MPDFVPVDHQPEFDAEQFVPPFLSDWAKQAAPKDVEILKQTAEPLINTMAAPGNALASTTPITPEQMIAPAVDIAGLMMGGGIGGVEGRGAVMGSGPIRKTALDMSPEATAARAKEQGYTIDAYKGGQPYDWRTMPDTDWKGNVIAGTENRVPQELTSINSPNANYAGFFSNDPAVANRFAEPFEHGAVWPTKLKFDNPLVIDAEGKHAAAFQFDTIAQRNGTTDKLKQFKGAFEDDSPHDGVILKNTKDEGDVYIPRDPDQIRSRFAAFDPANKGSGMLLGSGATDEKTAALVQAIQGIRAYHGSPHDFDAFDLSKIGTGEGAQAYGHGLYFAENEGVAKNYRDALAQGVSYKGVAGLPEFEKPPQRSAAIAISNKIVNGADPATAHASALQEFESAAESARKTAAGQTGDVKFANLDRAKSYEQIANEIKGFDPNDFTPARGKMYEVQINADPEHFLDWDKPLSEQHPVVVDALQKAMRPRQWDEFHPAQAGTAMKQGFIGLDEQIASEKLREAGLPGIKYLDQGSRTSGEGSRNYIVFNDKLIDILKKYGIAGLPAGIAATQTQPSQDDMVNAIRGQ